MNRTAAVPEDVNDGTSQLPQGAKKSHPWDMYVRWKQNIKSYAQASSRFRYIGLADS